VLELPELPILNKKQEALARVAKFKVAKEKAKEKNIFFMLVVKLPNADTERVIER